MKPRWKQPDREAIFIGQTKTEDETLDFWIIPIQSPDRVYVFVVNNNSGSFATTTMEFGTKPVHNQYGWPEPNWFYRDEDGNKLYMPCPQSSHYLGMEACVFNYMWKHLYGTQRCGRFGISLHPEGSHKSDIACQVMRKLKNAGIPLTEDQDMLVYEHFIALKDS